MTETLNRWSEALITMTTQSVEIYQEKNQNPDETFFYLFVFLLSHSCNYHSSSRSSVISSLPRLKFMQNWRAEALKATGRCSWVFSMETSLKSLSYLLLCCKNSPQIADCNSSRIFEFLSMGAFPWMSLRPVTVLKCSGNSRRSASLPFIQSDVFMDCFFPHNI